jgi:hypothetical protein
MRCFALAEERIFSGGGVAQARSKYNTQIASSALSLSIFIAAAEWSREFPSMVNRCSRTHFISAAFFPQFS